MIKMFKKLLGVILLVVVLIGYLLTSLTQDNVEYVEYSFRNNNLLNEHYQKHGNEMNADSTEEYVQMANEVINNPDALHKLEAEDSDDVYYLEETNELVIVSTDGYIRTYFLPDNGKAFFDKQ